jgi:ATP-dependent Clp protease protease subunit
MNLQILSAAALFAFAGALPATAQEPAAKPAAAVPAKPPTPEQAELTKLTTENQLAEQLLKKKLQQANAEKEELKSAYELDQQKQKAKTAALEAGLALASAENRLAEEKNRQLMLELSMKLARLKADNDLKAEQQRAESLADTKERGAIELDLKRLDLEERRLKLEKIALDNRAAKLASDLELRTKKAEWKKESNTEPVYTHQPLKNGTLTVSDRRIPLNGPIRGGVGDFMTERISYFNNISTQPIFIVIDYCPGGSTAEGYAILKAMDSSRAPVYVVVKSMAASMAAVIATLAERSYAYPSATILHHQPMGGMIGNITQQKEYLENIREWDKRLNAPVAKKMGVSMEEFRKRMYEKNSDGDWKEFADNAVKYKWLTATVDRIEETGVVRNPDETPAPRSLRAMADLELQEKVDEKGQAYVSLPRLRPFDFYFLYNRDGYYRY